MIIAENSANAIKLRQCKTELATAGAGYIIFGIWSVLKVIMVAFLRDHALKELLEDQTIAPEEIPAVMAFLIVIIACATFVVLGMHFYVGIGAIKASRGGQKKGYLIWARIFFVCNIIGLLSYAGNIGDLSNIEIQDTTIASFLVDLTVTMLLWGMIRSNKLIKELSKENGQVI